MNLTLESLNHIFTVIAVTAFLFSRKDYFSVLFEAKLLPQEPVNHDVQIFSEKISIRIKNLIAKNNILGVETEIVDLDNPVLLKLVRLQGLVVSLQKKFADRFLLLKEKQNKLIDKVNVRFKNTSFYISLVSFFLLVLAAYSPHQIYIKLNVFLLFFNLFNILFLLQLFFRKKPNTNVSVLFRFIFSCIFSLILVYSTRLSMYVYYSIKSKEVLAPLAHRCQPNAFYHIILAITLFTILSPWIVCFFRFCKIYFNIKGELEDEEVPILTSLNKFSNYLDTDEEILL